MLCPFPYPFDVHACAPACVNELQCLSVQALAHAPDSTLSQTERCSRVPSAPASTTRTVDCMVRRARTPYPPPSVRCSPIPLAVQTSRCSSLCRTSPRRPSADHVRTVVAAHALPPVRPFLRRRLKAWRRRCSSSACDAQSCTTPWILAAAAVLQGPTATWCATAVPLVASASMAP